MRVRLVTGILALPIMLVAFAALQLPTLAFTAGPACGEQLEKNDQGISMRVLFAKNGSVQRYVVVDSHENPEAVNDMRISLERVYGPEGVNAPALHITSFKSSGSGGMMVPDKAVDSCGRTQSFQ